MTNLGSLHANKHVETLVKAVSGRFSRTTDSNILFLCFLVTPGRKRYESDVPQQGAFAASMEAMWKPGVSSLARAFSDDFPHITSLVQNYPDKPQHFSSMMDLCGNYPRCLSIAGRQLDADPFTHLVKRIEASPETRVHVKYSFVNCAI
jgi:hypothetical protein